MILKNLIEMLEYVHNKVIQDTCISQCEINITGIKFTEGGNFVDLNVANGKTIRVGIKYDWYIHED